MYCNFRWPRGTNIQFLSQQLTDPCNSNTIFKSLNCSAKIKRKTEEKITPGNDSWKKTLKKPLKTQTGNRLSELQIFHFKSPRLPHLCIQPIYWKLFWSVKYFSWSSGSTKSTLYFFKTLLPGEVTAFVWGLVLKSLSNRVQRKVSITTWIHLLESTKLKTLN